MRAPLVAALGLALATAAGCAPFRRAPADEYADCRDREAVGLYLALMQDAVRRVWIQPQGVPSDATVEISFVLDAKGLLTALDVVGQTDPRLAKSALAAVRQAQPFLAPTGEAACIVGKRVTGTLSYAERR
jgi:hypothetical protein